MNIDTKDEEWTDRQIDRSMGMLKAVCVGRCMELGNGHQGKENGVFVQSTQYIEAMERLEGA